MIAISPRRPLLAALLFVSTLLVGACARDDALLLEDIKYFDGDMPADFSGSWARDYSRGDDVNKALRDAYAELSRKRRGGGRNPQIVQPSYDHEFSRLMPLARLAELITRPDELTISQTDYEILVERRDDYALMCAFFDGTAKPTDSLFGKEVCGWDGKRLISSLELPDGLQVVNRFEISDDRKQLRVITTVSSDTSRIPITLEHYYWRFNKTGGQYECIETLSMKRVCSTGSLAL